MNTFIPAIRQFWADLSTSAKAMFIGGNALLFLMFLLLGVSAITDAESRSYYRQMIRENNRQIAVICANEPKLCAQTQ